MLFSRSFHTLYFELNSFCKRITMNGTHSHHIQRPFRLFYDIRRFNESKLMTSIYEKQKNIFPFHNITQHKLVQTLQTLIRVSFSYGKVIVLRRRVETFVGSISLPHIGRNTFFRQLYTCFSIGIIFSLLSKLAQYMSEQVRNVPYSDIIISTPLSQPFSFYFLIS